MGVRGGRGVVEVRKRAKELGNWKLEGIGNVRIGSDVRVCCPLLRVHYVSFPCRVVIRVYLPH